MTGTNITNLGDFYSSQVKGTTSAAYVTVLTWDTRQLREKTLHIINTHVSLTMMYKVLATFNAAQTAGTEQLLQPETTLAPGASDILHYGKQYNSLIVQVIDGTGHATFEIDLSGGK